MNKAQPESASQVLPKKALCQKANQLLETADGAAFECLNEGGDAPLLLVCDHASNRIPASLGQLGLTEHHLGQHIAYDIGAAEVARHLAFHLNAKAVLSRFSRLVIDPNRYLSDAGSIPQVSDYILVPGNQGLEIAEQMVRVEELFLPYHEKVEEQIGVLQLSYQRPVLVSVHSFTPIFQDFERPWHIGILWNNDEDVAQLMIEELRQYEGWDIGDNQPYHACEPIGYSMEAHAESRGLPQVLIEVRQDLIDTQAGQEFVAHRLAEVLDKVIDTLKPGLN